MGVGGGGEAQRKRVRLDKEANALILQAALMLLVYPLINDLGRLPEASVIHRILVEDVKSTVMSACLNGGTPVLSSVRAPRPQRAITCGGWGRPAWARRCWGDVYVFNDSMRLDGRCTT